MSRRPKPSPVSNHNEIDPLISQYSHEKQRPREAEALQTLKKIASLVKPLMRARGWRVGTLVEFYPDERNLLGKSILNLYIVIYSNFCRLEHKPWSKNMPSSSISWRCESVLAHGTSRRYYAT